jgi:hypothetical protein
LSGAKVAVVESEWPLWVLEAAAHAEDVGALDSLDTRLRAAGFTPADLRYEGDHVGVFLGVRVAGAGDELDALFRLIDAEQFRHEVAAAKIKEERLRLGSADELGLDFGSGEVGEQETL